LNSSAAASVADFYQPLKPGQSDAHYLKVSRLMTAVWGVVQISVGVLAQVLSKRVVDEVLGIAAFTNGAILGVFLLGTLTTRVRQTAALIGMGAGIALMLVVRVFTDIAWPWYVLIGSLTTFLIGFLSSLAIEPSMTESNVEREPEMEVK
jgi:Na+/proline symporter